MILTTLFLTTCSSAFSNIERQRNTCVSRHVLNDRFLKIQASVQASLAINATHLIAIIWVIKLILLVGEGGEQVA